MIPSAWVELSELPLTSSGKVDRRALPEPAFQPSSEGEKVNQASPYESEIRRHFEELLSRDGIGLDDNFFSCGGHSLRALRLLQLIERQFGVRLPVRDLFEEATVRSLARRVEAIRSNLPEGVVFSGSEPLVTLQKGGGGPTLFVFPGGFGNDSEFLTTAWICRAHLGGDFSVMGFRNRAWRGVSPLRGSLREMAQDCIADMRRIRPGGPWHLAGFCVGGNLAFEVALQLQQAGEEVATLVVCDTSINGPSAYRRHLRREDSTRDLRQWYANSVFLRFSWSGFALTSFGRRLLRQRMLASLGHPDPEPGSGSAQQWKADRQCYSEWCDYQNGQGYLRRLMDPPRGVFRGRLDLILSTEMAGRTPRLDWSGLSTAGSEVHVVPGTHATYLVEGAARIAALFRQRLMRS